MDCTAGEEPCRESESSVLDSCSGERHYFCLPREQTYSFAPEGEIICLPRLFFNQISLEVQNKGELVPCLQGIQRCKGLVENCLPTIVMRGCFLRSTYSSVAIFLRKRDHVHEVLQ